jgi:hypothetical protein
VPVPLLASTANRPSVTNAFVGLVSNPLLSPALLVTAAWVVGAKNPVFTIAPLIVMLKSLEAVAGVGVAESVTWTVNEKVPAAVGVPEMTPVEAFRVRPPGNVLPEAIDHVNGPVPPLLANVTE